MKTRSALSSDAGQIAVLMGQLGYAATESLIQQKLGVLATSPMDAILVVEDEETLLGVISLHVFELFHQTGRIGRITSLVICESARGHGVGSLLVSEADAFFQRMGCVRAEVTSGDHRLLAHQFYQKHGYAPDERRFVKKF